MTAFLRGLSAGTGFALGVVLVGVIVHALASGYVRVEIGDSQWILRRSDLPKRG